MRILLFVSIASLVACVSSVELIKKCLIPTNERIDCGYPGIRPDSCRASGCCYEKTKLGKNVPWCYKASTNTFLTSAVFMLMSQDGIPFEVIASLYADTYPGAEWLLAFSGGQFDTNRLLQMIAGDGVNLNPLLANVLAGGDPVSVVLDQLAASSGSSAQYLKYLLDGNTELVLKHILSILSAQNRGTGLPVGIISSIISGQGLNSNSLLQYYASQLFSTNDLYTDAFYKSLLSGKTDEAIQWAYLGAFKDKFPQDSLYPKNSALFVALVNTQKNNPGKISPSIILALAKGEHIPALNPDRASFEQLFGVAAQDYICAAHSPNIQTDCRALQGYLYVTEQQCLKAGCCLQRAAAVGEKSMCFENVLGSIGVYLASNVIDEDYIRDQVLGGELPDIDPFIPWVPNHHKSDAFENFIQSSNTDIFTFRRPTAMPIKPDPRRRPGWKWLPHGPTPIPFPTRFAPGLLVPTEEPGRILGEASEEAEAEEPIIAQLTLNRFSSKCFLVQSKDRFPCISNQQAYAAGGEAFCRSNDCCFEPNYQDLSVPACFRLINYGQCYAVPHVEREDCGSAGINKTTCELNPQCCWDSVVPLVHLYAAVPWCYYKKRAPIKDSTRCARPLAAADRVGCFTNPSFNSIVSQATCESVEGCCYKKEVVSWFDRVIGRKVAPPTCYKGRVFDIAPTVELPTDVPVDTESKCLYAVDMSPYEREDCGALDVFNCLAAGCCIEPVEWEWRLPWCFKKTDVPVGP